MLQTQLILSAQIKTKWSIVKQKNIDKNWFSSFNWWIFVFCFMPEEPCDAVLIDENINEIVREDNAHTSAIDFILVVATSQAKFIVSYSLGGLHWSAVPSYRIAAAGHLAFVQTFCPITLQNCLSLHRSPHNGHTIHYIKWFWFVAIRCGALCIYKIKHMNELRITKGIA